MSVPAIHAVRKHAQDPNKRDNYGGFKNKFYFMKILRKLRNSLHVLVRAVCIRYFMELLYDRIVLGVPLQRTQLNYKAVLWIRIRIFWLDLNPPKKFGFGFGFRHCCKIKKIVKNRRSNTWKRKKRKFFSGKSFFLCRTDSRTHKSNERHHFKQISGQNISIRIRIQTKFCLDPNPK
jgi:hypothetical protein